MKPPLCEGPLGFPLTDQQAFAVEAALKALPRTDEFRYRKAVLTRGPSEVLPGERSDVSWITTEAPDRTREVVIAHGMDDSQYRLNPIVTMQHAYSMPPVGRSLWRKVVRDGALRGVKAKTQYPPRPDGWTGVWPADAAFALVQADLLRGKSIGFLPTKVHVPDDHERQTHGWGDVQLVIDEWLLLEYACTFLPAQQLAVVEAVSRNGLELPEEFVRLMGLDGNSIAPQQSDSSKTVVFTPIEEIERAIARRIDALDIPGRARKAIQDCLDRARGRV
jgi:hypothetical protein